MRKKSFAFFLLAAFLLLSATPLRAEEIESYSWFDKLKRASINIVTSPVEIARSIQITSEEDSLLEGWTIGIVKGLGNGIVRLGAGVIELVTFPFDFPDDDKAPILNPEYVWQKPGVKYTP